MKTITSSATARKQRANRFVGWLLVAAVTATCWWAWEAWLAPPAARKMWTNQEPARLSECVESLVAALPRAVPSSPVLRNRQFADELDNCITLNVRDSVSMQHVTRVVVRQVPWSGWWTPDDSQIVACGDSPLAVPVAAIDRDQGSRWAVSAPQYAREEMTISAPADRDLWLSPGGSITVMAPDVDLRCDARLQLRRADMASRPIGMSAQ